ncbi:MAG: Uma2 family endonuclease [Planctomycetes bacterium]|nr:Uma2 family endonuclease [Planctomycetota bacterium]
MPTMRIPQKQRLILDCVPWNRYTRILRDLSDRHLRVTYDRGFLEIMTISHEHDNLAEFLDMLLIILFREMKLPFRLGGSTTLRRRRKQKGVEPDKCYWIAHAAQVRGKKAIDLRRDPPPDLALEVDITHSSLDRMRIYASLKVPEVWRWDKAGLSFMGLNEKGEYASLPTSRTLPIPVTPADLMTFIAMREGRDDSEVMEPFTLWVRSRMANQPQE